MNILFFSPRPLQLKGCVVISLVCLSIPIILINTTAQWISCCRIAVAWHVLGWYCLWAKLTFIFLIKDIFCARWAYVHTDSTGIECWFTKYAGMVRADCPQMVLLMGQIDNWFQAHWGHKKACDPGCYHWNCYAGALTIYKNMSLRLIWRSGPIFRLFLEVSSDYAQPITGQVTEVTCPVIGRAQPEFTPSKRQKTGPDTRRWCMAVHVSNMFLLHMKYNETCLLRPGSV